MKIDVVAKLKKHLKLMRENEYRFFKTGVVMEDWEVRADRIQTIIEAIDLLQPKVLSLEEVMDIKDILWIEIRGWQELLDGLYWGYYKCGFPYSRFLIVETNAGEFCANFRDYGKDWRIWNIRPSEEQMKETPWDDAG